MSVYHCENDKAITQPLKALYFEVLCLMEDFLLSLKNGKEFQKYFDMSGVFLWNFFSCIYCFLSQGGSMSKTLRRYSGESFLTCFKHLCRVTFVALQGKGQI